MSVLDPRIQSEIEELEDLSYYKFVEEEYEESFDLREQIWSLYPEPKENWNEAYNSAKYAFLNRQKIQDYDGAKHWLNRMIAVNNNLHQSNEELTFYIAVYQFDTKNYEESYERFKEVAEVAQFRYFENEDPKYMDFYKHPEKYITNQ